MNVKPILRVDPGANWGRLVNFEDLRKERMDIEPEITAAGWRNLFQIREPVYLKEVYEFWKNTKVVDDTIVSYVENIPVIVTKELLERVTECSSRGVQPTNMVKWMTKLKMNEDEVGHQLYGKNNPTERRASWLVPKARVLFAVLCDCVLPRIGSRHQVTTLDEQCILHLLNHQPIDLPFLIFQYMVKSIKDTNTLPYGMLLTRMFRESGIRLELGIRQKVSVRSYIDATSIAKMGLKFSDRQGEEAPRKATTEGEPQSKKSSMKERRSQSKESKSRSVRFFESGSLKRKGESLVSDIHKQARTSPTKETVRQKEASPSRDSSKSKHYERQKSKATKSLSSILEKVSETQSQGNEGKRKAEESEKKKVQAKRSPRLKKMSARKEGDPTTEEKSKKTRLEETVVEKSTACSVSAGKAAEVCVEAPTEACMEAPTEVGMEAPTEAVMESTAEDFMEATAESVVEVVKDNIKDSHKILNNPIFEEIAPTGFHSTLVHKQVATHIMGQKATSKVVSVLTNIPSMYLTFRRERWEHRLVVREEKKVKSVIIRDNPKRYVKAVFKPVEYDNGLVHLLDRGYKNFYDQLKRVGREPYPPEPFGERITSYPILSSTIVKVVPDLQPPNFVELNYEKLKLKVQPEPVLDDMSSEQIEEAVKLIDQACEMRRSGNPICVYQDPGPSLTKATAEDPQGGKIRIGQYCSVLIGNSECCFTIIQNILRNRPLWEIISIEEAMPWFESTLQRLGEPYDLDINEQAVFVPPPRLQIIEENVFPKDAYTTTVETVKKQVVKTVPSAAEESSTLKKHVQKLDKDMKKIKKMLKKLMKQIGK